MATFAIDFDSTLYKRIEYPKIGDPIPFALETIKELICNGHELVLWTCRNGLGLDLAIQRLAEDGINFHHINSHPQQTHISVKIDADFFIDDKAIGCPLVFPENGDRPYVDWNIIREMINANCDFHK